MRAHVGFLACLALLGLVALVAVEPRLHHEFPSMIDDWNAIASAPEQLRSVLELENPTARYRPGFTIWNALQWHTLGAPTAFGGPRLWGLLRIGVLVLGVAMLARLLVMSTGRGADDWPAARWLLTFSVPLLVLTVPAGAIDLARYGPQEPLLVGCMSLGAALLVRSADRLLEPTRPSVSTLATTAIGLAVWWLGVLQKETSLCALVLIPFLTPTALSERRAMGRGRLRTSHRAASAHDRRPPPVRADARANPSVDVRRRPRLRRGRSRSQPARTADRSDR